MPGMELEGLVGAGLAVSHFFLAHPFLLDGNVYPVPLSYRDKRLPLVSEGCRDVWKRRILHDKMAMSPWGPGTECHTLNVKCPP